MPSPWWAAGCGAILAVMFTLREVVEYMAVVYAAAVFLIFGWRGQRLRAAVAALVLLIPPAAADMAVRGWNYHRTGAFMVTIGLQTAGLHIAVHLEMRYLSAVGAVPFWGPCCCCGTPQWPGTLVERWHPGPEWSKRSA